MSQTEVADLLGVNVRTWGRYETGVLMPPLEILFAFAEQVHVEVSSLLFSSEEEELLNSDKTEVVRVPIVNRIPASGLVTAYDEEGVSEWVTTSYVGQEGLFGLRVRGDSMAPKIEDGDIVILAPRLEFENNKIYSVVTTDSEHTLKRVRRLDHSYICMPLNMQYQEIILREDQVLRLIRVVQIIKYT